ncbi:hypothetical protein [Rhodococcus spelaei]|uniref:hypothetical protein n=1 Tax=Rhodococcus spelaei TaxID=2546320 RepID=UPI001FE36224|nr:hypothetical protein [Rhodococcus spelaei]
MRETVVLSGPTLHSQAANAMKVLSRLAVWALDDGLVLDREVVLTPEVLERYRLVGMRELAPTSRAAEMSRLRRIARTVTVRAPWPPPGERSSRQELSPPYTDAEVAAFWRWSTRQNGPFRVQAMTAVLALTLGVGARSGELFAVTASDVVKVGGVTAVRLGSTPRRRVVPVRRRMVPRIRDVCRGAGRGPLVASTRSGRDQAAALVASFECARSSPKLTVARLRSTWLTHVLADCSVAEIFSVAGIRSGKTLSDLIPYLPAPEAGSPAWRRMRGEVRQ